MPYPKDSRRRHAKPSVQSKSLAPPSTLSVLSSSTSGSNSTVTPARAFQSSLRPSKRGESSLSESKGSMPAPGMKRRAHEDHSDKENINVFSYMEKEESENETDSSAQDDEVIEDTPDEDTSTTSTAPNSEPSPRQTPGEPPLEANPLQAGQQQHAWRKGKVREGSLHSDSGISVRSSSPEQSSPALRHAYPNVRPLSSPDKGLAHPSSRGRHVTDTSPQSPGTRESIEPRGWPTHVDPERPPEEYYLPSRPTVTGRVPVSKPASTETRRRQSTQLVRNGSNPSARTTYPKRAGYDVLASAIHSRGGTCLKPIYRKFEMLSNRILLYLQDELSEMENELRGLDHAIAREDRALGKTYASRRAELRLPSQLQWRRLDLLGRSYAKVEQYNRALASYSNLTKSLEPASQADINAYREWIAEHRPIVEQEAAFLQMESDLVAVSARANGSSPHLGWGNHAELETPVIIVAFSMVSTIIVFKFVPRFLARIVISAMVGMALLCMLSPGVLNDFESIKRCRRGITMYSAVMIVLAIVVN